MYVRFLIGGYAGEIRDVAAEQARGLIARGEAVDASRDGEAIVPQAEAQPPVAEKPKAKSKKK